MIYLFFSWKWEKVCFLCAIYQFFLVNVFLKLIIFGLFRKSCSESIQQNYRTASMPKCDFNKIALQLYWNCASAWVFSCKFTSYFQNSFSKNTCGRLLLYQFNYTSICSIFRIISIVISKCPWNLSLSFLQFVQSSDQNLRISSLKGIFQLLFAKKILLLTEQRLTVLKTALVSKLRTLPDWVRN